MMLIHAFLLFTFGVMVLLLAASIRYYFKSDALAKWPRFLSTIAIACGVLVCIASIAVVVKHGCCDHGKGGKAKCKTEQCDSGKDAKCKTEKCSSEKKKSACCDGANDGAKKAACTCPPNSDCGGKCGEKGHEGAKKCKESGACGGACAGK